MTENTPPIEIVENGDSAPSIAEPTKKRAYKPRAPKVQAETLETNETPVKKPRAKKSSIDSAARQIEGLHKMVSVLPNMGFMEISNDEARILAEAMSGVADEYGIQIGGKTGATLQLIAAAAMIYTPRVMYGLKMRKQKKAQETGEVELQVPVQSQNENSNS